EFLQRHAVSFFGMLVESARHLTNLQVRVESKEYSELRPIASQEFQDAENVLVGLLHVLRFDADRHFVKMGYQVDRDNTRGANFDYWGHRFLGGFQYTLPWWDVKLSYDYSLHYRDYLFRHSRFPESQPGTRERSDHEQSHAARIELPLPNNFRLAGDYLATISRSNLAPFSYEREVFTLSVLRFRKSLD
ncbi:MAG: hypothetical protein HYV92_07260, partial [Candidatus Rokubacteria bacterium]|nr:hypothetical protein [Candidatus Rokubacteria bacterium]